MSEKPDEKGITVKKQDNMPDWYGQVVVKSKLIDYSPVRGTIIMRPYSYSIWQKIQDYFNQKIKALGVENAYFPMFIPESFFKKEAEHAEGFSPEVAWVANKDEDSNERLALRPTSETIMYDSYSRWIRSHRDLPLRINQWCNIVRWEVKDVKAFLRGREFLWQEGHCVYETEKECDKEVKLFFDEYVNLIENVLAIPVIQGKKSKRETFAGAKYTLAAEAFMPDGKFLQCSTSHNLGQGFAKAFDIKFVGKDEKEHLPWQSSWGFSTRLIGALVMQHGDDKGLILPPKIAPIQVAIVPILFTDKKEATLKEANKLKDELKDFDVKLDDRDEYTAGYKFNQYEMMGVPIRLEIGPKDIENNNVMAVRRDTGEKIKIPRKEVKEKVKELLENIQNHLFDVAKENIKKNIVETEKWEEFLTAVDNRKIIYAPFCGEVECENEIKDKTKGANSRCVPLDEKDVDKKCVHCKKKATKFYYFGKNY